MAESTDFLTILDQIKEAHRDLHLRLDHILFKRIKTKIHYIPANDLEEQKREDLSTQLQIFSKQARNLKLSYN